MDNGTQNRVTDPEILRQLNAPSGAGKKVTDPGILQQLEAAPPTPTRAPSDATATTQTGQQGPLGYIGETLSNVPKSTLGAFKNITVPLTDPIGTVRSLAQMMQAGQNPTMPESQALMQALGKAGIDRYGSLDKIGETVKGDPVGFLLDLSFVLGGAGGAVKLGGLSKAGKALETAGAVTDPIRMAAKGIGAVGRTAGKVGSELLGVATGKGGQTIREAAQGSEGFREAMRGHTTGEEILTTAQKALGQMRSERSAEYTQKLAALARSGAQIDKTPIMAKVDDLLTKFNIKTGTGGELDFSRSTLNSAAHKDVKEIVELVQDWGSQADDLTPVGMDMLKKRLDDFYTESNNGRVFVTDLKNTVKNQIRSSVPEYDEMLKPYEQSMRLEKDIRSSLSLKGTVNPETAIRKLTTALRTNNDFRRSMIAKLEEAGGKDIQAQIAGLEMRGTLPAGNVGRIMDFAALYRAIQTADPTLLFLMTFTSPRVVGEFLSALGSTTKAIGKVTGPAMPFVKAIPDATLYQLGKFKQTDEQK